MNRKTFSKIFLVFLILLISGVIFYFAKQEREPVTVKATSQLKQAKTNEPSIILEEKKEYVFRIGQLDFHIPADFDVYSDLPSDKDSNPTLFLNLDLPTLAPQALSDQTIIDNNLQKLHGTLVIGKTDLNWVSQVIEQEKENFYLDDNEKDSDELIMGSHFYSGDNIERYDIFAIGDKAAPDTLVNCFGKESVMPRFFEKYCSMTFYKEGITYSLMFDRKRWLGDWKTLRLNVLGFIDFIAIPAEDL